ncbi:MAG: hypothetical protein ABII93_03785 [Chrysiogenia bacterium]
MGGFVSLILSVLAGIMFYGTGHPVLFWLCVIVVILSFWSWGVMHNYAMESAKARWDRIRENMIKEERLQENIRRLDRTSIHPTKADINSVPDWITSVNMFVTFVGLGLLIWGIIARFF